MEPEVVGSFPWVSSCWAILAAHQTQSLTTLSLSQGVNTPWGVQHSQLKHFPRVLMWCSFETTDRSKCIQQHVRHSLTRTFEPGDIFMCSNLGATSLSWTAGLILDEAAPLPDFSHWLFLRWTCKIWQVLELFHLSLKKKTLQSQLRTQGLKCLWLKFKLQYGSHD